MAKKIKKSNHRFFAIIFSTLIIIALAIMVPLSLSSLNITTDNRSEAKAVKPGNAPTDQAERELSNKKFRINSRKGVAEYIYFDGTYIPEIDNTLQPGTYELDVQYQADEISGRGLAVAIVCVSNSCPKFDGNGTVGVNEALYNYSLSSRGIGARRMKTQFTVTQAMSNNTIVRLFASDGTNVEFDFVKLTKTNNPNQQLLKNSSFTETRQATIERINGTAANSNTEIYRENSFINTKYQSAFKSVIANHYGQPNVLMYNGPNGERDMIIRSRQKYALDPSKTYRLEMHYFMPTHTFDIGRNTFNFDINDEQGNVQTVVTKRLQMKSCNYVTGLGCTYKLLTTAFKTTSAGNFEFNFNVNTRIELFVDAIKVVEQGSNGNDRTIWLEEFNDVSAKQIQILVPRDWVVREPWKQVYGMSYPW